MEDDDDKDDTKRKSRNLSEKKRRDQFNLLVNELNSMVSTNSRKMDKSTVLKSTIAFLKNHNEVTVRSRVHEIQENWKPSFLPNDEFTHLILEALDGFIVVFSSSGKIHYASESITSLLGHLPSDLLTMSIYDLLYEEEHQNIYNILLNPPKTVLDQLGVRPENQVTFLCHLKRGSLENPPKVSFEYVQFSGYFRDNIDVENMMPNKFSEDSQTKNILFVGTGRLMTPQLIREMSIVGPKSEFTSRHSLEWKFLFLDHRAPPIIGYLPFEVLGTSGYDYYHFEDLDRVVNCHETLMQKGEGTSCFYRFLTKGQQWIWLQTRFYITYHQWNSKPEFVVCTHRVVSFADVMKHVKYGSTMKSSDDNEDMTEDRKTSASASNLMAMSPWSSKSSRASKSFACTQESPRVKFKRSRSYRNDSDSTSMSADSPLSHHSVLTQHSSLSQRSRSRSKQNSSINKPSSSQPIQCAQFNIPQSQSSNHMFQQPHQILPTHQSYIDQTQYIAAIPMQPVLTSTVITPVHQAVSDYSHPSVVLTSNPNNIQDHLQRKHEELQKLIVQQQDELRRVSEQLFMARYGIIPSIVSLPCPAPMDQSDSGLIMNAPTHITHPNYLEQLPQMIPPQIHIHQPSTQILSHQQHVSHYELNPQKVEILMDSEQQNDDILQYMQHQTQQQTNSTIQQIHQTSHQDTQNQQVLTNEDFELMPFQMMNQQAQILLSQNSKKN